MNDIERIKGIAFLYLDGNSDAKDDKTLFEFLSQSDENKRLFSEWENEWKSRRSANTELSMLISIEDRIAARKKRISAVCLMAAAAVVLAVSMLIFIKDDTEPPVEIAGGVTVVETGPCDRTKVILPDGSSVRLNSCSRLAYDGDFNREERRITLSGEAFFDVRADSSRTFVVDMGQERITVRGTKFNVAAYGRSNSVSVALVEGKIEFNEGETSLSINPGEVIVYDKVSRNLTKHADDVAAYCTWTEGRIEYPSVTLAALLDRLSCVYDLDIRYVPKKLSGKTFSISLSTQENIKDVLDAISVIMPIKWTKDDNMIIINEI